MVLQDLGRRINTAISDLTRASTLDEKVKHAQSLRLVLVADTLMAFSIGIRGYDQGDMQRFDISRRQREAGR